MFGCDWMEKGKVCYFVVVFWEGESEWLSGY